MDRPLREQITPLDDDGVVTYYTGANPPNPASNGQPGPPWDPQTLIEQARQDEQSQRHAVCVVQNISDNWKSALQNSWNIEPSFFVDFARNPEMSTFWEARNNWTPEQPRLQQAWHVDGIFEHHFARHTPSATTSQGRGNRHYFVEYPFPPQSTTRISYCRVHEYLYLVLIDAPGELEGMRELAWFNPKHGSLPVPTTLRVMYANNRGGLLLPQSYAHRSYDLMESLKVFLQHRWHFDYLFAPTTTNGSAIAIQPHPLLYLLSSSVWQANLKFLDESIKHLSFIEIRDDPTIQTNSQLHDMRESLAGLKAGIAETITWAPNDLDPYFKSNLNRLKDLHLATPSPFNTLHDLLEEAKELQAFLMETFQLLMSSLSVRDSQISIHQSRRGTLITILAFIYVPLSFVTGIFGMNIKEVNGSPLDVWVCFVALAVVVVSTVLGYAAFLLVRFMLRQRSPAPIRMNPGVLWGLWVTRNKTEAEIV